MSGLLHGGGPPIVFEAITGFDPAGGEAPTVGLRWRASRQAPVSGERVIFRGLVQDMDVLMDADGDPSGDAGVVRAFRGTATVLVTATRIMGLLVDGVFGDERRVDAMRGAAVAYGAGLDGIDAVHLERGGGFLGGRRDRTSLAVAFNGGPGARYGALLAFRPFAQAHDGDGTVASDARSVGDLIADAAGAARGAQTGAAGSGDPLRAGRTEWSPAGRGRLIRRIPDGEPPAP